MFKYSTYMEHETIFSVLPLRPLSPNKGSLYELSYAYSSLPFFRSLNYVNNTIIMYSEMQAKNKNKKAERKIALLFRLITLLFQPFCH